MRNYEIEGLFFWKNELNPKTIWAELIYDL